MRVYLEVGQKRAFACALEWPGYARAGRDADAALEALDAYAPRYAAAVKAARAGFKAPARFSVVERLRGDATTEFGAPGKIPRWDLTPPDATELKRTARIMRAIWSAFDAGVAEAKGATLATGPRGGGRTLAKIADHVLEAEAAYLTALGGRARGDVRDAFVEALGQRARGELPGTGPRGGKRWPARYAARRAAWHVLDHLWEVEDRTT